MFVSSGVCGVSLRCVEWRAASCSVTRTTGLGSNERISDKSRVRVVKGMNSAFKALVKSRGRGWVTERALANEDSTENEEFSRISDIEAESRLDTRSSDAPRDDRSVIFVRKGGGAEPVFTEAEDEEQQQQKQEESSTVLTEENIASMQVDDGSLTSSFSYLEARPLFRRNRPRIPRSLRSGAILAFLFATWYYTNTVFNVYNKRVLQSFPFPYTCTTIQFLVASVLMASLWLSRLKSAPALRKNPKRLLSAVLPLAAFHAAGFLLTNVSLGAVSVAFTHTVKATEPFFSVALSPSILGEVPTWGILGSLFPIVAGVVLASATEASFTWVGFLSAMGSNLMLQSRNVLSKRILRDGAAAPAAGDAETGENQVVSIAEAGLDNINLFAFMSMLAFCLMVPVSLAVEGVAAPLTMARNGGLLPLNELVRMLMMGGLCRCGDVLASYMILNRVSPVTHSVGNCVKRAVVIVMSVLVFQTPMSWLNLAGTVLALVGVLVYSLIIVGCKQNKFGEDSLMCKPVYDMVLEEGAGI